jgi:Fe-S oxidoreductase
MCERQCPAGTDISTLMAAARAEYVRRRGLRRTEFVLGRNRYLSALGSAFAPFSNVFMRLTVSKWGLETLTGIDRRRAMPPFRRGSFVSVGRRYLAARGPIADPVDRVAYFVDTYAGYNDHELGFAALDVLRHNRVDVVLPKQKPAPLPAIVYGDVKAARRDLAYTVKRLAAWVREGYKVVCSEPSAALCLKEELRHYVCGEDAQLVSQNAVELMSYLDGLRSAGQLKPPNASVHEAFSYHLPCHLSALGDEIVTLRLLREHFGVEVTDLAAGCCGLSGTFGMQRKNYDLALRISNSLRRALDARACESVLTECAACKMQIEHIAPATTVHPVKLIARCYGLGAT